MPRVSVHRHLRTLATATSSLSTLMLSGTSGFALAITSPLPLAKRDADLRLLSASNELQLHGSAYTLGIQLGAKFSGIRY